MKTKQIFCLAASLLLLLAGMLTSNLKLVILGIVSFIVALTSLKLSSKLLLGSFWIWMNLVLLYLSREDHSSSLVLGLPLPAFWMLFGIWIVPVLLWPLGFALTFKRWSRR